LLGALARSEQNAVSMSELSMRSLVAALNSHCNDPKFVSHAFAFLTNLCVHPAASESVIVTGAVGVCLQTIVRHKGAVDVILRGLHALENIAYGSAEVKDYMRKEGIESALDQIQKDNVSRDDIKRACKAVLDALNRVDTNFTNIPLMSLKPMQMEKKSAKAIFGDDEKKSDTLAELPQAVKNFLLAGQLLSKHSNTANPKPKHVYVTPDLKWLVWKNPGKAPEPDSQMKVFKIRTIERGRCTPQLQRKKFGGKFNAKEECAFAILGRDRTLDLETPTEAEREKWINYLNQLLAYRKGLKQLNSQFGKLAK